MSAQTTATSAVQNVGQLRYTDGTAATDVKFYANGNKQTAFYLSNKVAFTAKHSNTTTNQDTLFRVDMAFLNANDTQIQFAGMAGSGPIPDLVDKEGPYDYFFSGSRTAACKIPLVGEFQFYPCIPCQRIVSTEMEADKIHLNIFPNPFEYNIVLANTSELLIKNIQWSDVSGRLVFSQTLNTTQSQISVESQHLQPGIYFVQIQTERGSTTFKMIKTQ